LEKLLALVGVAQLLQPTADLFRSSMFSSFLVDIFRNESVPVGESAEGFGCSRIGWLITGETFEQGYLEIGRPYGLGLTLERFPALSAGNHRVTMGIALVTRREDVEGGFDVSHWWEGEWEE
jgi:hypothetical protein